MSFFGCVGGGVGLLRYVVHGPRGLHLSYFAPTKCWSLSAVISICSHDFGWLGSSIWVDIMWGPREGMTRFPRPAFNNFCQTHHSLSPSFLEHFIQVSDTEDIDVRTHGFSRDVIPEANDMVRVGLVGGFAIQKVNSNKSYFRWVRFSFIGWSLYQI